MPTVSGTQGTARPAGLVELARIAQEELALCGIRGVRPERLLRILGADWTVEEFRRRVIDWCDEQKEQAALERWWERDLCPSARPGQSVR